MPSPFAERTVPSRFHPPLHPLHRCARERRSESRSALSGARFLQTLTDTNDEHEATFLRLNFGFFFNFFFVHVSLLPTRMTNINSLAVIIVSVARLSATHDCVSRRLAPNGAEESEELSIVEKCVPMFLCLIESTDRRGSASGSGRCERQRSLYRVLRI